MMIRNKHTQDSRMDSETAAGGLHFAAPVLGVCGHSNSGKTTLLEEIIPVLCRRGLAVAVCKHAGHGFQVDRDDKDSARLHRAGANVTLVSSQARVSFERTPEDASIIQSIEALAADHDLVLVEGLKEAPWPRIWLESSASPSANEHVPDFLRVLSPGPERTSQFLALLDAWLPRAWCSRPLFGGVLMGGAGSRMGTPKHLVAFSGQSLLERVVASINPHAHPVVLLGGGEVPEPLHNQPRLADVRHHDGPLAGILAGMRWAPHARWLIAGCDYPQINSEAIHWLLAQARPGTWAVLPRRSSDAAPEPLLAYYEPQARRLLEVQSGGGRGAPSGIAPLHTTATPVVPREFVRTWQDVDTPADLADAERHQLGDQP